MAIIQTGAVIADVRGKIGGAVFQKSAAGLTLRNKTNAVNVNSALQNKTRGIIKNVHNSWQGLTDSGRATWTAYAKFWNLKQKNIIGNAINGQQLFLKINTKFLQYNQPLLTIPAFTKLLPQATVLSLTWGGGVMTVTSTPAAIPGDVFFYIKITGPKSLSSIANPKTYKIMNFVTTALPTEDITLLYLTEYGSLPPNPGKVYWYASQIGLLTGIETSVQEEGVNQL